MSNDRVTAENIPSLELAALAMNFIIISSTNCEAMKYAALLGLKVEDVPENKMQPLPKLEALLHGPTSKQILDSVCMFYTKLYEKSLNEDPKDNEIKKILDTIPNAPSFRSFIMTTFGIHGNLYIRFNRCRLNLITLGLYKESVRTELNRLLVPDIIQGTFNNIGKKMEVDSSRGATFECEMSCVVCDATTSKFCRGCPTLFPLCSVECQKTDWPEHPIECSGKKKKV